MRKIIIGILSLLLCAGDAQASSFPAQGSIGSIQTKLNTSGEFGALALDTAASYAAHNTIENGLSYDPRDPKYGAICGGYNIFSGDGSTTTFTYTIPFTGSSSTDNSNFMVFYEPTNGTGSATILTTSQFSVTGVNSGTGGAITLNTAPPSGNTLVIAHDDSAGFVAASVDAVATGGYISVPDSCTIYGTQTFGTILTDGAQLIGQGFTPNYGFQGQGIKPIMRIIAPTGAAPNFGINVSGKNQQFFEGFEITSDVPGANSLGYLTVPVLIGANGSGGAGGGQSPGIVAQFMTFNYGLVGFGAPIGGSSTYIFSVLRFNNFVDNSAGVFGPLSDAVIVGNDFAQNGVFGTYGSAGGLIIGPAQGAVGAAGASRVESNRFEFNSEGVVVLSGALINFEGNQFDANFFCGLNLNASWSDINLTGGWFRGNATGPSPYNGSTAAGKDGHICFNSTSSSSGGLYLSNVKFLSNHAEGKTAPLGSAGATTPPYVLDFNTAGANNNNVELENGSAFGSAGNTGAYVTDFAIYRNGRPSNLKININGQSAQGVIANGQYPSQARGLAANSWSAYDVVGDPGSFNNQLIPLAAGYGGIVGKNMGVGPTYFVTSSFGGYDCDVVNAEIVPNITPNIQDAPVVTWLPTVNDPGFGAGFFTAHQQDTNSCRLGGLTWMAVPKKYKTYAQSTNCTPTGSWSNSSSYTGYYGVTDSTNGDSLACSITTTGAPVYLWYLMQGSNGGTFTYQIDSGPTTTVATQGNNSFTFPISTSSQTLGGVRIPVPGAGAHTVNIVVTSATSSSNTVTIEGIGTAPANPLHGSTPAVYLGGQLNNPGTLQAAAVTAFNNDEAQQSALLAADGLSVSFVPIQKYVNAATDYNSSGNLNALGQGHVADAFSGGMQYVPVNGINPLNYGASCNTQMFNNNFNSAPHNGVTTTAGSPVVSVANYVFQPGTATQNGGGDVGKVWSPGGTTDEGPTTYIVSVDTTANTATLGENMLTNQSASGAALMGGYPTNPNDPSTAADDTIPIQNASAAALKGGGIVTLPPNCMVHNLIMSSQTALVGNNGGNDYVEFASSPNFSVTPLYVAASGFSTDVDAVNGKARSVGISTSSSTQVKLKDFTLVCDDFPFNPTGMYLAGIGQQTPGTTDINPDHILVDHLTITACPVAFGQPLGNNLNVVFTGSIAGNVMTVTAITSTNFNVLYTGNGTPLDFLAVGRPVTGTGVPSNTKILSVPAGSTTGNYILSTSSTVGSETLTSAPAASFTSGTMQNTQMAQNGMGINGGFSDFTWTNNIGTNYGSCVFLGPSQGSAGSSANRFLGGRCETGGGFTFDGGGSDQLTGMQFQATNCAIHTIGSGSDLQITGGWMQGNDCDSANSNYSQVLLGGTWSNIDFSGVQAESANNGGGANHASKYVVETETGASIDYLSVEGGEMRGGFTTAFENFTNQTPTHYKRVVPGLAYVDTTQSALSANITGNVGIGTLAPNANAALDMSAITTSAILPTGTTGQEPTCVKGMIRFNSTVPQFEGCTANSGSWVPFGGISLPIGVSNGGTGLTGGTSGGVLAFTAAGTLASSGALTANLPVIGGGAGAVPTVGSVSGNTTIFATSTGTLTNGHCVSIDGSGNFIDAGGACTTGGGGGTVASSTIGQIPVYTGTTTVTGSAAITSINVKAAIAASCNVQVGGGAL